MRVLALTATLGLLVILQPAAAQEPKPKQSASDVSSTGSVLSDKAETLAAAERKRAEARANARQRQMDRLTKSICVGC